MSKKHTPYNLLTDEERSELERLGQEHADATEARKRAVDAERAARSTYLDALDGTWSTLLDRALTVDIDGKTWAVYRATDTILYLAYGYTEYEQMRLERRVRWGVAVRWEEIRSSGRTRRRGLGLEEGDRLRDAWRAGRKP